MEAIYLTLRAAFPNDRYYMGAAVSDIVPEASRVCALIEGRDPVTSDVLIAADGANSPLRRRFLPAVAARYAGYVAWRGTLDEWIASSRLVSFLDNAFTFCEARSGGHMLAYFIPGDEAAYRARASSDQLGLVYRGGRAGACPLSDRQGRAPASCLAGPGLASAALIGEICDVAEREVHPIFAELVATTADPFVQTIVDVIVPQTVFGRVMLVGDAAFVVRPHTAGATAKAAHDAWVLGRNLARARGNIDAGLKAAESLQLEYGNELTNYGIALGGRWANLRPGRKAPGGAA